MESFTRKKNVIVCLVGVAVMVMWWSWWIFFFKAGWRHLDIVDKFEAILWYVVRLFVSLVLLLIPVYVHHTGARIKRFISSHSCHCLHCTPSVSIESVSIHIITYHGLCSVTWPDQQTAWHQHQHLHLFPIHGPPESQHRQPHSK